MLAMKLLMGGGESSGTYSDVYLSNQFVSSMGSGTQAATYRLSNTGVVQGISSGHAPTTLESWLLGGTASDYEARVTGVAGSLTGGTVGSWLNLGTTRDWYISETTPEWSASCEFLVEIRKASVPGTILASATIEVNASVF